MADKVLVRYDVNGATSETVLEGHRVSTQLFADGRGMCVAYDDKDVQTRCAMFAQVYVMDKVS